MRKQAFTKIVSLALVLALSLSGFSLVKAAAAETAAAAEVESGFADVADADKYYYEPVYWAASKNITTGRTAADEAGQKLFDPSATCTRREVVTFLWRLAGLPEPSSMKSPFTDVTNPEAYYYKAVLWAAELGITSGRASTNYTTFDPKATCTRSEVVTFLWRYAGRPMPSETGSFTDAADPEVYYYYPVYWALENSITYGRAADNYTTFDPKGECTRAMVVSFLYRYAKSTDSVLAWWGTDENGNAGHGYTGFAQSKYGVFVNENGKRITDTGLVKDENNWYNLRNGQLLGGWSEIDGDYYFLDRTEWTMVFSATYNGITLDEYGVAEKTAYASEKVPVMMRARDIVYEICDDEDSLDVKERKCLNYIGQFPYYMKGIPIGDHMDEHACYDAYYANYVLNAYGDQTVVGGECSAQSVALGYLYTELDEGEVVFAHSKSHGWIEMNGYFWDALFARSKGDYWYKHPLPYPSGVYNSVVI